MSDRPSCGTCPHRVRYLGSYGCACETLRGVAIGDTLRAAPPYVPADYPGCQHHPHMRKWLASLEEPAAQSVAESKPQRYGYRQPGKTLSDELAELSVVRDWLASLPYPPPGETLGERLAGVSAGWLDRGNALAELEQWRGAIVWRSAGLGEWALCWTSTGAAEVSVSGDSDGMWYASLGTGCYYSRDAAMRAAEAAFGLPPCRVEGEP